MFGVTDEELTEKIGLEARKVFVSFQCKSYLLVFLKENSQNELNIIDLKCNPQFLGFADTLTVVDFILFNDKTFNHEKFLINVIKLALYESEA